jgi:hypothetical protein
MSSRPSCSGRPLLGGRFDAIDAELDPGICDKMPLLQGYTTERVLSFLVGA